jgi:hypothetical protein
MLFVLAIGFFAAPTGLLRWPLAVERETWAQ